MSPTQLMQRAIALPLVVVLELVVRAIGVWDDLVMREDDPTWKP